MRRLGLLVFGILAAANANGCGSESGDEARADWTWLRHEGLDSPAHLSTARIGAPILAPGDDVALRTVDVLSANRALFRMRAPADELVVSRRESDRYGMQHVRFQQVVRGVPVVGAEVSAHYDDAGHLASIDANYIPDLGDLDVTPRVPRPAAADDARLVIYAKRLAWEYRVRALASSPPAIWLITVDAQTGEELHRRNDVQTIAGSGIGVLGDTKTFEVSSGQGGFVMTDASTGVSLETYSAATGELTPGALVSSTSATSWDTAATGKGAAVDAHFNAGVVARYYKTVHGRNAIDGVGGALQSTVHYGEAYENAAWIQTGMIYGDGGKIFKPLSVAVDVVGHEFTHGVTEKTSHLTYEGQPGALNEAISDIFGAFIEHSILPDAKKNWIIGELVTLSGGPLRDMMQPHNAEVQPQPAHMSEYVQTQQDAGGVHINSGIINNAAWLMTVGGTNPISGVQVKYGIGWEKSEKLWYQAATNYFQSSTGFVQAAAGVMQAAEDVHLTDNERAIVECAFIATGVSTGECATLAPTDFSEAQAKTATGDDADASIGPKKKTTKKKKTITTEESGCNAARRSSGQASSASDLAGAFVPVLGALAAICRIRRRRGNFHT